MLNDPLANVLSAIVNYEKIGKKELLINPVSNVIKKVLAIMQEHHYIGALEELHQANGGFAKINLLGNINNCGVVKPRFSVKNLEFQKFEKRYLPANGVGILIISTPEGIMTHDAAREKGLGGRLLAYCY
ncbi:30S ribosomal protein S8 [Candidatus Woesearchaeota archaeon CG10_big_fil_rev_8_21_14_0_10_37_12]|nr:MAG: 30S ribosomal protein S8 [Candidatus Woesearchaeota archaeon CG10_big_fil_rev_8_21_14_0_10_37_12]